MTTTNNSLPAPTEEPEDVGTPDLTATADALGGNANLPNPGHDPSGDRPPQSPPVAVPETAQGTP